jgi:uncharacterized membrane-anchored protein YhcB (DUF1043 family)
LGLDATAWLLLGIAAALFLAGVLAGMVFGGAGRRARARARRLEAELRQTQEELDAYQDRVAKHFDQTSDLFGDLTRQYSAVWDHLAEGARGLCADRMPALGHGFTRPPLLVSEGASSAADDPDAEATSDAEQAPAETPELPESGSEDEEPERQE